MKSIMRGVAAVFVFVACAQAADFATRGGPAPANVDEIAYRTAAMRLRKMADELEASQLLA